MNAKTISPFQLKSAKKLYINCEVYPLFPPFPPYNLLGLLCLSHTHKQCTQILLSLSTTNTKPFSRSTSPILFTSVCMHAHTHTHLILHIRKCVGGGFPIGLWWQWVKETGDVHTHRNHRHRWTYCTCTKSHTLLLKHIHTFLHLVCTGVRK